MDRRTDPHDEWIPSANPIPPLSDLAPSRGLPAGADSPGSAELDEALAAWEVSGARLESLRGGATNEHWRVESDAGVRVLRRYHSRRASESLPYEHELLRFLAEQSWPVAAPIATVAGATVVETDRGRWALFPFMRGEPPPSTELSLQRKGAVLALLHADLAGWTSPGQRPTFGRVTDLDSAVAPEGFRSFEDFLAWYADDDPERAAVLARTWQRNAADLEARGYTAQPDGAVYYECFGANVLFSGDTVTALLDFDMAHEDARVADIARSLVVDCRSDSARVRAWLAGYAAHAAPRLDGDEAELIPPLMVASELWNTVVPLAMCARDGSEALLESARTSIDHRLPLFEAVQPALGRAAAAAAS